MQPVVTKIEMHHPEVKRTTYSPYKEEAVMNEWYKILGKSDTYKEKRNEQNKSGHKIVVSRGACISKND